MARESWQTERQIGQSRTQPGRVGLLSVSLPHHFTAVSRFCCVATMVRVDQGSAVMPVSGKAAESSA